MILEILQVINLLILMEKDFIPLMIIILMILFIIFKVKVKKMN